MSEPTAESFERLASRLALLVSSDSEADNAGRAAGALARRLGLSGGQLKAIFLAGAAGSGETTAPREAADRETAALRHTMEQLEIAMQAANRERNLLRDEVNALREALDRARTTAQVQRIVGGLILAAVVGGAAFAALAPSWHPRETAALPADAPWSRAAVVRETGAVVFNAADAQSAVLARLPAGTRVSVRQVVWHSFNQWAETVTAGETGYIAVTDLDMP